MDFPISYIKLLFILASGVFLSGVIHTEDEQAQQVVDPHGVYLSVVQIDHLSGQDEALVVMKVFSDDLRNAVRAGNQTKIRLTGDETFCLDNKALIETYFRKNFLCRVNNEPLSMHFKTGNLQGEVYLLQFSLSGPTQWKKVAINAAYFTELFSTQTNIIHLSNGREKRFARLNKKKPEVVFNF